MTQPRTDVRTSRQMPEKGGSRKLSLVQKRALLRKGARKWKFKGVSRRQFLGTAAAGATLAVAPVVEAAHRGRKEGRTLFFNFSHEDHQGYVYYLVLGTQRFRLKKADSSHPALRRASQTNKLLQSLPPGAITHVLENVQLPTDQVLLGYTLKDPDTAAGTWAMSSVVLQVPTSSTSYAYTQARKGLLEGAPLPLSAKRMKYGLPAAVSLQDLMDEQDVLDSTDWAKAMVNVHPEMLSAEPNSAAHIQNNLIDARSTFQLSQQLELAGPAVPQQSATPDDSNNASGWATLVPYTEDDGVTPLKNTSGKNKGLILYDTIWQPHIKTFVAAALKPTSSAVKNDTTLGADVSGGPTSLTADNLNGVIWYRRNGITSVNQSGGALGAAQSSDNVNYTLDNINPYYNGYSASASSSASSGDAKVTLTFSNWYLRWLGLYAQFFDGDKPVPLSSVPQGVSQNSLLDLESGWVYMGILTPEFTIYGIPVSASSYSASFSFPTQVATSATVAASGIGYGSRLAPETEPLGIVLTSIFNLILPAIILAVGVGTQIDVFYKVVALPSATLVAQEFVSAEIGNAEAAVNIIRNSVARWAANPGGPFKIILESFFEWLGPELVAETLQDAIPIVGVILQCLGVAAVVAELTETAVEVALSPKTYAYNLVGTHDLSVTLTPDSTPPQTGFFPSSAATYTVKANFDYGTPHVQTLNMPSGNVHTLPPVVFQAVPLGGSVTVSVAFYTVDGTLVGHGTTTAVNDVSANPTITVSQDKLPITGSTVYMHKQKTTLDARGNHVWACAPAPAAAPTACEANPGNLCSFRNITVSSSGYIGYGWQSYNNAGCASGGAGQLDQMANILFSNDSGGNAQAGYAFTPCALQPGTKLVYDPLGRSGANYYVDLTNGNNLIRQIQLNPPSFTDPRSNNAWGQFNLNSDDLLLHPAGALVSINSNTSRMESLHLPSAAVSDAEAGVSLLANLHGGRGSRPGLFNTPTVSTITSDGVILILESGNNRIHALDLSANPVQHFKSQPTQYFLNFSVTGGSGTQYLDMAVEFSGFIYVLSYSNSVYRLDIYHPDQNGTNPISTTMGFNAAKVTVDYWRNVYSLNYEVLKRPDGSLPANGITEPSISQWLPTTPPPCEGQADVTWQQSKKQQLAAIRSPRRPLRRRDFWRAWV